MIPRVAPHYNSFGGRCGQLDAANSPEGPVSLRSKGPLKLWRPHVNWQV